MAERSIAHRRGEIQEFKFELNSDKKERRKNALKKVISHMTMGKDVSTLFPDVVNCLQTDKMDIKKLVYLYIMNYAKTKPQMAIMAVNTFVKDTEDPNPLIRSLAIRTMGCIRLDSITEYICGPLKRCAKDEDPYVRKTAAVCICKLYSLNPALVEEEGLLKMLKDMLNDSNPMVIANTVASLSEIASSKDSSEGILDLNSKSVSKLLTALNECTEWGQIFILDSIIDYTPENSNEAKTICERVSSRLSHANSAVILSATKVLLHFSQLITHDESFAFNLFKKISPSLVTLLSSEPEIQYVALKNINIITQKYPRLLVTDIKAFYVKYNDPIYVKVEKLAVLNLLVDYDNVTMVLSELKEYSTEVDVDFVKKSIRSIGFCALKVEVCADACVKALVDLIETKVSYVVQEGIVVLKDIFRKYPNKYESVIEKLSESLNTLDDPEARASMIWILGEYSHRIEGVNSILKTFFDGFFDEASIVQLQLITAIVKLFLKSPAENQELVQLALTVVTQQCSNPDIRDRGYIYWRLLSQDPNAAKLIILSEKPLISEETSKLEQTLLDELLMHLASLASIYHKTPHSFVYNDVSFKNIFGGTKSADNKVDSSFTNDSNKSITQNEEIVEDLLLDLNDVEQVNPNSTSIDNVNVLTNTMNQMDLNKNKNFLDLNDLFDAAPKAFNYEIKACQIYQPGKKYLIAEIDGKGLEIQGVFSLKSGILFIDLTIKNLKQESLTINSLAFDKNTFGISISPGGVYPSFIVNGMFCDVSIPLNFQGPISLINPINLIKAAIQTSFGVFYFSIDVPIHFCFIPQPTTTFTPVMFEHLWAQFPTTPGMQTSRSIKLMNTTSNTIINKLQINYIFLAHQKPSGNSELLCFFSALRNNIGILFCMKFDATTGLLEISVKSHNPNIVDLILLNVVEIMS